MTLKKLCAGLMAGAAGFVLVPAAAQQTGDDNIETVTVVGLRAMMNTSVARQRAADGIESVVTRDAIGQFPDQNVAEATRRLPGVNVLDDQGEGRFISVRGLAPDLNSASVNGVNLPAPEADIRAVALDVVPSELVESIEVIKTLTPDMDADTIGATIKINTTKGFDRKDPFFSAQVEGSYNNLNGKWSPKYGIDFAYPISDKLGIAGGFSYSQRHTSTDNMEMAGWSEAGGVVYADTVEYRDYDVDRIRMGTSLSIDFKPFDGTTLYARTLYSVFTDQEQRRRLVFGLGEPTSGTATTATFDASDASIKVRHDLKDRYEAQIIQSYQLGGESVFGDWLVEYQGAFSRSSEHEWQTTDPTRFEKKFKKGLVVTFDYSDLETTTYSIDSGEADFLDPTNYELSELSSKNGLGVDKEWAYKLDFTRQFALANGGEFALKFGGKARLRNKVYDSTAEIYDGYDGDYSVADVLGTSSYGLVDVGPVVDRSLVRKFNAAGLANGDFEYNAIDSEWDSNADYYDVDENIYAGYVMGRYSDGPLMVAGGLRVEHTADDVKGNMVELVEAGGTHGGATLSDDTIFITPVGYKQSYTDVLPSIAVRYNATDETMVRLGVFKSVVRPKIGDIAPRFLVEENDSGEREGEFGNPDLNPYRAWNFDLSGEWYFAKGGVIQLGAFYKKINDFIVEGTFDDGDAPFYGVFNGVAFNEATIPLNGDAATAKGIEFNYQQALTMLPGPFDGLLVGFNYTYTDASGDIGGRTIPLPSSSKHTFNAMLGYENGPWSLRATAAYRSGYLDEIGGSAEEDRYVKKHMQVDFSIKYKVTDNVRIYAEMVNMNNEPYLAYQRGPGRDRLLQYETYSWTGKFGIKTTF